jgi:hypothetical protein
MKNNHTQENNTPITRTNDLTKNSRNGEFVVPQTPNQPL